MLVTIKNSLNLFNNLWLHFKFQTQIILITITLLITLTSSLVYEYSPSLEILTNTSNAKFLNDIDNLLISNIRLLSENNESFDIVSFCQTLYKSSNTIRYIIYIDQDGANYSIPYDYEEFENLHEHQGYSTIFPFKKSNQLFSTIISIETQTSSSLLILKNDYSIPYFPSILAMNPLVLFAVVILGIVEILVIHMTINRPINQVSKGLLSIAAGNFSSRVNFQLGHEFNELTNNFNELGRRLELYEEKNQEQLRSERLKLESLITTITDGVLLLDTNLQIILVNQTAVQIFGWKTKTKLIGTTIWEHLPKILQKKLFVTLQNVLQTKQSVFFDSKIEKSDYSRRTKRIRISLRIIYDSFDIQKVPIGVGLTIQDLTKEFELDQTQNRFIGNISHELRTPLFNIKSFIETIQEYDYSLSNWQKRYFFDIVNKETNRLTRLLNDILCISRLDFRKEILLEKVCIKQVINLTITNYQIIARDKNLYLYSDSSFNELNVYGSHDLLLQVLTNIIGNALKFTYRSGEILIRTYPMQNKKVRIEIVDTGIGIINAYQQYIFQRFYRVENTVHTLKGTGLGLSIVNTILSEHKTKLQVVSRYKVGSIFWFDLARIY